MMINLYIKLVNYHQTVFLNLWFIIKAFGILTNFIPNDTALN
uniref:Uncharacterized protein n=1 Tax=Dipterocladia arabiensis TaxID=2007176 RepID=A0A1Z1M066_9FLOR|nr:hypothetical protein [Dipterocladia arabiensis]ARW59359.1 hypothetical protein [Dipterocladia arabiensis]